MSSAHTQGIMPHFANDAGVAAIYVGIKAFKCMGASPPMDHPHVFLEMGAANEIVCPYCSTKFIFDDSLAANAARPPETIYQEE